MAIPTQFPALAIRSAALQALVLQAGQVLEGKVLGTAANGTTQVQIGKQTLNLTLPMLMAAGSSLTLQAQGCGAQQKLVLLTSPPPTTTPGSLPPTPASVVTVTQQSPAAAPPAPQPSATPAPPVPLSTRPGALQPLALQPGQQIEARVLGPTPSGATQIQIGRQTITVTLPTPLPRGTVLPLQVEGQGPQQRLVLLPQPAPATVPQPGMATSAAPQAPATAALPQLPVSTGTAPLPGATLPSNAPIAQTAAPPSLPSAPIAPPSVQPGTPQAALTQMVQTAVQRQDSLANLTTVLAAVVGKVPLPQPVLQAAQQVLAASLPLGPALDGAAMQKAIASSGIFQEAVLAQGAPALAKGDLKTTLLVLRNTLVTWLGQTATPTRSTRPIAAAGARRLAAGAASQYRPNRYSRNPHRGR